MTSWPDCTKAAHILNSGWLISLLTCLGVKQSVSFVPESFTPALVPPPLERERSSADYGFDVIRLDGGDVKIKVFGRSGRFYMVVLQPKRPCLTVDMISCD